MMNQSAFVLTLALATLPLTGCRDSTAPPIVPTATPHEATPSPPAPPTAHKLSGIDKALAGAHRNAKHKARDEHRHPKDTLSFFGLRPDMTVVEIWPGNRAYYTEILAPVLGADGKLIAATLDPDDDSFRGRFAREFRAKMLETPELYDQVALSVLMAPDHFEIAPAESADMVLSFRSAHNWIRWQGHEPAPYFKAIANVLKPGGIFGIVQHRAPKGTAHGDDGTVGYLHESLIITLAEDAGLKLIGKSDINANPKDDHDHPEGVWTLPPTLRLGDEDMASYLEVGESDRMTLKFQKPSQ